MECLLQGVCLFSFIQHKPLKYLEYEFPSWGEAIGWIMALSSIFVMPIYAIYLFVVTPGTFRQVGLSGVGLRVVLLENEPNARGQHCERSLENM